MKCEKSICSKSQNSEFAYFSSSRGTYLAENKNTFQATRVFSNDAFIIYCSYNLCSFLVWKWWCQWNWLFPWEFVSWPFSLTPCFPNMSFPQILHTLRDTWGCQFQKAIGKDSQSQVWSARLSTSRITGGDSVLDCSSSYLAVSALMKTSTNSIPQITAPLQ